MAFWLGKLNSNSFLGVSPGAIVRATPALRIPVRKKHLHASEQVLSHLPERAEAPPGILAQKEPQAAAQESKIEDLKTLAENNLAKKISTFLPWPFQENFNTPNNNGSRGEVMLPSRIQYFN